MICVNLFNIDKFLLISEFSMDGLWLMDAYIDKCKDKYKKPTTCIIFNRLHLLMSFFAT